MAGARGRPTVLLLDYDGTLVPLAPTPEQAAPDAELLVLLAAVGGRRGAELHIVSGRPREVLERWLGSLPAALHAEHGLWVRRAPDAPWEARFPVESAWMDDAARILGRVAGVPGSFVERKTASLAWHYRLAEPSVARHALDRLRVELRPLTAGRKLELLEGARVLELRDVRASKGAVASAVVAAAGERARFVAMGDDRTDEDMFAALPDDSLTIHVGDGPTCARQRLASPGEVRSWLEAFVAQAPSPTSDSERAGSRR